MKLTEARLKQLILETLEDESALEMMIKSGQWPMINQALTTADDAGLSLKDLPLNLLPLRDMDDADLVELAKHLLDNTDVSDFRTKTMLHKGVEGMIGDKKNAGRQYVIMAIEKLF